MVLVTEEIDLPAVQPKSFKPAIVSPKSNNQEAQFGNDGNFTHKTSRMSRASGLSLRVHRVTPDRKKEKSDKGDIHGTSGSQSHGKRLTGKGSRYSGATPMIRGTGKRSKSPNSAINIERQQKLQDEYYRPSKGDESIDEADLDDGELPSLRRSSSTGRSRPNSRMKPDDDKNKVMVSGFWSQLDENNCVMEEDDGLSRGLGHTHVSSQAAAIIAASAIKAADEKAEAARTQRVQGANNCVAAMDDKNFELLKVAGFWSQLDDVDTIGEDYDSYNEEDAVQLRSIHHNFFEEEEMPNDERQWRRSQSPHKRDRSDIDTMSIGLGLQQSESIYTGEPSLRNKDTNTISSDDNRKKVKASNWNLLEKAVCYAHENPEYKYQDDNISTGNSVDQSLDQTFQTMESTTNRGDTLGDSITKDSETSNNNNNEDHSILNCITDVLGTICGYSSYVAHTNADMNNDAINAYSASKREKALAIINKNRSEVTKNQEMDGSTYKELLNDHDFNSRISCESDHDDYEELKDNDSAMPVLEDAAIELEYLTSEDHCIVSQSKRVDIVSNADMSRSTADDVAPLVSDSAKSPIAAPEEPPMSPITENIEKKKKRVTVKSVQNLLGLRRRKVDTEHKADSPLQKTVETQEIMMLETQNKIFVNDDVLSSPKAVIDQEINVVEEEQNIEESKAIPENVEFNDSTNNLHQIIANDHKTRSIFDDEELQSQSAGWDTSRKNSYLRELAQRAKQEYHAKKVADNAPDPDLFNTIVGASVPTPPVSLDLVIADDLCQEKQESEVKVHLEALPTSHIDYNSFNPVEKRKFLRLLNSGVSPQDATRTIVHEREEIPPLEEDNDDEFIVSRSMNVGNENEEDTTENNFQYDEDEGDESILTTDPPGEILDGDSGESAELSTKENQDEAQVTLHSDLGIDSCTSGQDVNVATSTHIVPEIVQAKTKAKFIELLQDESLKDDEQVEKEEKQESMRVPENSDNDGFVLVGNKYYDFLRVSDEKDDTDNVYLLRKDESPAEVKHKSIRHVVPSVAASFAKVISRRTYDSSQASSSIFGTADVDLASTYFSRSSKSHAVPVHDDITDGDVYPPPSDTSKSSKFGFINLSSKWTKLQSDYDDKVDSTMESEVDFSPKIMHVSTEIMDSNRQSQSIEESTRITTDSDDSPAPLLLLESKVPLNHSDQIDQIIIQAGSSAIVRNVTTPTNESIVSNRASSSVQPPVDATSSSNSLFMSPDTLSPTSPQDLGSLIDTPSRNAEGKSLDAHTTKSLSCFHDDQTELMNSGRLHFCEPQLLSIHHPSSSPSSNNLPLIPDSPDDNEDEVIENSSLMEKSFATTGTTWTIASKSSRRRHKGAAGKRLMQAKDAESHISVKSKGWIESIRDVATTREQGWDPDKGWVDYSELEKASHRKVEPIGSLHLTNKIIPKKSSPIVKEVLGNHESVTKSQAVGFSAEWIEERNEMIRNDQSKTILFNDSNERGSTDIVDDKSAVTFESLTGNTTANGSLLIKNMSAPIRRASPKYRSTAGKRKIATIPEKVVGWKDSMEAAAACMMDESRQWNYENGWTEKSITTQDDVTLMRNKLKRSPRGQRGAAVDRRQQFPVLQAPSSHYPLSVAEDVLEVDMNATFDGDKDIDKGFIPEATIEDFDEEKIFDSNHIFSDNNSTPDDKTNGREEKSSEILSESDLCNSPKLVSDDFCSIEEIQAEKENLPSCENERSAIKKSLNQWLEKSIQENTKICERESENAVHSCDLAQDELSAIQLNMSMFSSSDEIEEADNSSVQEIHVETEKCNDCDIVLFQSSDVSDSFQKKENTLLVESCETQDPTKKVDEDVSETDFVSVSSRARAWLSSMEKMQQDPSLSVPIHPQAKTVIKKLDPKSNLDPPSSAINRSTLTDNQSQSNFNVSRGDKLNVLSDHHQDTHLIPKRESKSDEVSSEIKIPDIEEESIIFHSAAMGIRLKRGEDGFVRVVSVTEASEGSSIVREGDIEPDDIIREAAGVDLRSPITNSKWGEVVSQIRNSPRPMKFVVAGKKQKMCHESIPNTSCALNKNQVINERIATYDHSLSSQHLSHHSSEEAEDANSSDIEMQKPKESFFKRIASCAASTTASKHGESSELPLAHLAFLRTNPTIVRVRNEATRRYPAFCGRPDTIFEEPDDSDVTKEKNIMFIPSERSDKSHAKSYIGSGALSSSVSSESGDNTAFLESLAVRSAISSKLPQTRHKTSTRSFSHMPNRMNPTTTNEVEWPDNVGGQDDYDQALSSYRNNTSSQLSKKKNSIEQAENVAGVKVVAMMKDNLGGTDSVDQCEI